MKRARFLLIFFALAMLHLPVNSKQKKMKYADNILYYGEVDKNKQPIGKGQLQLIGYAEYALDIINGDFVGKKIINAEVLFGYSDWPNDPTNKRTAEYAGTLEFDIEERTDGSAKLVYKLTDGILKIERHYSADGHYLYKDLSITCKPQDHCVVKRYSDLRSPRGVYTHWSGFHKEDGDVEYVYKLHPESIGYFDYFIEEKMSKAKEERLKAEAEQKLKTPKGLAEKIIELIYDKTQSFSDVISMTDKLLAMEKTDEQKQAVKRIIKQCQMMGTGYNSDNDLYLSQSHEGTDRGRQEIALATKLQEYMIEGGDMQELIDYAYRCRQSGDTKKAKIYFQKAADEGNVMAMRGLAFCYEDENNMKEAEVWYMKLLETDASEQYCVDAMDFFRKNNRSDKILQILELSAEKTNNRDAMLRLGDIYRNGHDWEFKKSGIKVTKNFATALKWYKKARETGSKAALFFMADCYWNGGPGVPQNRVQAGKLYNQLKEEAGLINMNISEAEPLEKSRANYQFGYCLETGTGVVKNIPLAWDLYGESIEADAYYRKAVMLEKRWVDPTLRSDFRKQRCRVLYQLAANLGHKQAQQALNRMYR